MQKLKKIRLSKIPSVMTAALISTSLFLHAAPPPPLAADYIYEVTSDTGSKSYIFGSVHYTMSSFPIRLGTCTKKILTEVDLVYLEASQLAARSMTPDAVKTIEMSVVANEMEQPRVNLLSKIFFGNDQPSDIIRLRDLDVGVVIAALRKKIFEKSKSIGVIDYAPDAEIELTSRFLDKPLDFIETPEEQLYFHKIIRPKDLSLVIDDLIDIFQDKNTDTRIYREFSEQIRSAAVGEEAGLVEDISSPSYQYDRATIYARNESMTKKVAAIISNSNKTKFIALGAAHLAGEGGVIQRLRTAGFTAKRLCKQPND